MTVITNDQQPTRFFLGVPQTAKMQVYSVGQSKNAVINQIVLTNTSNLDATITLTINTIDSIRELPVGIGETKIIDLYIVLNAGDAISLQQSFENAINVTLNGTLG